MIERKEFKRLNAFHNTHAQTLKELTLKDPKAAQQLQINKLVAAIATNNDTTAYRAFKHLRSAILFAPTENGCSVDDSIKSKIVLAEETIANVLSRAQIGNKQYERADKTKTASLPYVDVEVIQRCARGESHLLFMCDDGLVLAYGDNSRGQLLPLSGCDFLDKAAYLPAVDGSSDLLVAKDVSARENCSAVLDVNGRLLVFGEGWTDRYVVITGLTDYDKFASTRTEIVLIGSGLPNALLISSVELKDYLLEETLSHKENDIAYSVDIAQLEHRGIARHLKLPTNNPISSIVTGSAHVLLLSASGKLFGYGANDKHQLSYAKEAYISNFIELPSSQGETVRAAFAFADFSIIVDETGSASIFGRISRTSQLNRNLSLCGVTTAAGANRRDLL